MYFIMTNINNVNTKVDRQLALLKEFN